MAAPCSLGLAALDDRLASSDPGVVRVRVAPDALSGALEHITRQLRLLGRMVVGGHAAPGVPAFATVGTALGIPELSSAARYAGELAASIGAVRAALVVVRHAHHDWDRAVISQAKIFAKSWVVVVNGAEEPDFEIVSNVTESDRARFLWVLALDGARKQGGTTLEALRGSLVRRHSPSQVGGDALRIARALAAFALPVPLTEVERFGTEEAWAELEAAGELWRTDTAVMLFDPTRHPSSAAERHNASALLVRVYESNPFSLARAAELELEQGPMRAEALHIRALELLRGSEGAAEVRRRWVELVCGDPPVLARACDRSLNAGDAPAVTRVLGRPAVRDTMGVLGWVLLGRALAASGDLAGANNALDRAFVAANRPAERALALAARAETAYVTGSVEAAQSFAREACATEGIPAEVRLDARNVLGKVLISQGKWPEAERHFVEDADLARESGARAAELRAKHNRAIVLQSQGLLDEAERLLRELARADSPHDERLTAMVGLNLASLAMARRDMGTALGELEQVCAATRLVWASTGFSEPVAVLAELRYELGLFVEAEQAIADGRRYSAGRRHSARLATVASRIALARGDTFRARTEATLAVAEAAACSDLELQSETHRIAARLALEDGDVVTAAHQGELAAHLAQTARAHAEVAIIQAYCAVARGEVNVELARLALSLAREACDDALTGESLLLVARLYHERGETEPARAFLEQATKLRDGIAAPLAPNVRAAFLLHPQNKAITALATRLDNRLAHPPGEALEPTRVRAPLFAPASSRARKLVTADPGMLRVLKAVRRAGPSDAAVLILGESGTGKELIAEGLHRASARARGPLVSVNCAALSEEIGRAHV